MAVMLIRQLDYTATLTRARAEARQSFTEVERSALGIDHAMVGSKLASDWWLSDEMAWGILFTTPSPVLTRPRSKHHRPVCAWLHWRNSPTACCRTAVIRPSVTNGTSSECAVWKYWVWTRAARPSCPRKQVNSSSTECPSCCSEVVHLPSARTRRVCARPVVSFAARWCPGGCPRAGCRPP